MFLYHISLSLALLALIGGVALYVWAARNGGKGNTLVKVTGMFVIVVSILNLVCTAYCGMKFWRSGYFPYPGMNNMQIQDKPMMSGSMMGGDKISGAMNEQDTKRHSKP